MDAAGFPDKQSFQIAMQPRRDEIATLLAADRPPDWEGYRFEAEIECENSAVPELFTVKVKFGDRVSNRQRGGVPRKIVDKLAELRMEYINFPPATPWRTVVMEQIWNRESKGWTIEKSWTY